jgi:hypothetical protein
MDVPIFKGSKRRHFFTVPADAENVCVQVRPAEHCSAQLVRPDGSIAATKAYKDKSMGVLSAKRNKTAASEVWSIVFPKVQEDARFRIGAPAIPVVASGSADMALTVK